MYTFIKTRWPKTLEVEFTVLIAFFLGSVNYTHADEIAKEIKSDDNSIQMAADILAIIENEINSPPKNEIPIGSFLSYSQNNIRKLILDLAGLGPGVADYIYSKSTLSRIQIRSALTISLGLMGDPRVHVEIRNMVSDELDLNMRTLATLALGKYNDTADVPILVQALHDTTEVLIQLDFAAPNGEYFDRTYPLRGAANNALVDMGYRISKDSLTGEIIVKKQE